MKFKDSQTFWDATLSQIEARENTLLLSEENISLLHDRLQNITTGQNDTLNALTQAENVINAVMDSYPYGHKPWNAFGYCMKHIELLQNMRDKKVPLEQFIPKAEEIKPAPNTEDYSFEEQSAMYYLLLYIYYCLESNAEAKEKASLHRFRKQRSIIIQ